MRASQFIVLLLVLKAVVIVAIVLIDNHHIHKLETERDMLCSQLNFEYQRRLAVEKQRGRLSRCLTDALEDWRVSEGISEDWSSKRVNVRFSHEEPFYTRVHYDGTRPKWAKAFEEIDYANDTAP